MNKLDKNLKKLLPRIGAFVIALVVALGCVAFYFLTYKAGSSAENTAKFVEKGKKDNKKKTDVKEPNLDDVVEGDYNFLIMGHDRAASLTDVMMIVNFNTENGKAAVMQIPRDTFVRLDDYYYHKLNGAYYYFIMQEEEAGSRDPELDACVRMADFLEENMAIEIHYSAVMDLDGFASIVDSIGGVDIYVPQTMIYDDPGQGLHIELYEGQQHLDGDKAEQFVRYRYGYYNGDIGRENAQKIFMSAFIESLKSNIGLSNVADVASEVFDNVKTDMPLQEIIGFGRELLSIDLENVTFFTMPGNAPPLYDGASYYVINKEAACEYIHKYYNVYSGLTLDNVTDYFDRDLLFTTEEDSVLKEYYYTSKDLAYYSEYDGQTIEDGGLVN